MTRSTSVRLPLLPRWLRWAAVVAIGAFIFYVSIVTVPPETPLDTRPDIIPLDKWRHFLAYAAFGISLAYATTEWDLDRRHLAVIVIGTTVVYGVGIEFWQSLIPARYFSIGDAWANTIGGLVVVPWYIVRPHLKFVPVRTWLGAYRSKS